MQFFYQTTTKTNFSVNTYYFTTLKKLKKQQHLLIIFNRPQNERRRNIVGIREDRQRHSALAAHSAEHHRGLAAQCTAGTLRRRLLLCHLRLPRDDQHRHAGDHRGS